MRDQVQTVTGAVPAGELGRTLVHEHLRFGDEAVRATWPQRFDAAAELAAAVAAVTAARDRGVRTIVDPTAMLGGRDVGFLQRVAAATGVHVVACTGIYTYDHLPQYFANRSIDEMADHFVEDLEQGMEGTTARAAFLKCAADEPGITPNVEHVHRAVARASVRTGAPVMAHSRPASRTGPRQVAILLEEGVDPSRVQVAHTGDTDDLDHIEELLALGVWIGLDRFGLQMFLPDDRRLATTAELLRRGHAARIMLSQDFCATIDFFSDAGREQLYAAGAVRREWSMTLVLDEVVPALRAAGLLDADGERTVFEDNPRRWLTGS